MHRLDDARCPAGAGFIPLGEERAMLMNSLLPAIARYFLLDDVDILGAFANFESPRKPDWKEA